MDSGYRFSWLIHLLQLSDPPLPLDLQVPSVTPILPSNVALMTSGRSQGRRVYMVYMQGTPHLSTHGPSCCLCHVPERPPLIRRGEMPFSIVHPDGIIHAHSFGLVLTGELLGELSLTIRGLSNLLIFRMTSYKTVNFNIE